MPKPERKSYRGLAIRAKVSPVCRELCKSRIVEAVFRVLTAEDASFLADMTSAQSTSHQENSPKPAARILIAEDRPSMRRALGVLFALHKNWEVCGEAEDANEAIRKTQQLHPDLIVLDYKMHCSDGFQAANGILRALPDVPIVMFTLYKTDELERAANQIGIRRVIGKEEGVHTLLHAMEQLLPAT
jgi:CheY-like chemotaxis protein